MEKDQRYLFNPSFISIQIWSQKIVCSKRYYKN